MSVIPVVPLDNVADHAYRPSTEQTQVAASVRRYIIPRKNDSRNYGHLFPRGTVSLVAGASGAGKTVFLLDIMENLRLGRRILTHAPVKAEYGFILLDRTGEELKQTMEDKGFDEAQVSQRCFEGDLLDETCTPADQLSWVLTQWKQQGHRPDVVVLEGADLWCENSSEIKPTIKFLKPLIKVATEWGIAIIASVGNPKQKPKERYQMTRDQVFGSIAWGRICSTVLQISLTDPEDSDSVRLIQVLPRTGRRENYYFQFEDGRLVYVDEPPEKIKETKVSKFDFYLLKLNNGDQVEWSEEVPMSRATFYSGRTKASEGPNAKVFKRDGRYFKV